jgi:hypothetical protein
MLDVLVLSRKGRLRKSGPLSWQKTPTQSLMHHVLPCDSESLECLKYYLSETIESAKRWRLVSARGWGTDAPPGMLLKRLPATINMIDRGSFSLNELSGVLHWCRPSSHLITAFSDRDTPGLYKCTIPVLTEDMPFYYRELGATPQGHRPLILTRDCSCVLTRRNTRSTQRVQSEFLESSVVLPFPVSGWIRLPFTWLSGSFEPPPTSPNYYTLERNTPVPGRPPRWLRHPPPAPGHHPRCSLLLFTPFPLNKS